MPHRVSMIVMGHPQFETQDDIGIGDGVPAPPEWQLDSTTFLDNLSELGDVEVDYAVRNVLVRLRYIFRRAQQVPLQPTRLHDLTCFVIHRLLLSVSGTTTPGSSHTECIRYATILYMFIIQGPTYYSHAVLLNTILTRFLGHLKAMESELRVYGSLDVWLLAVGLVASTGSAHYRWFMERAQNVSASMQLADWENVLEHVRDILWLEIPQGDDIFRSHWDTILDSSNLELERPDFMTGSLNDYLRRQLR